MTILQKNSASGDGALSAGRSGQEISMTMTSQDTALSLPASELFAPATIEPLFWRPRFMPPSPVLAQAPFLFWLCNAVRPRNVAVLGAGDGVAHFALCQALDKLNLSARCAGYGFWDNGAVPAALQGHEAQLYEDLSTLAARPSAEAVMAEIEPASLDLMAVDLDALDDAVPQYEEWFARLGPKGVLVLHGTDSLRQRPGYGQGLARRISELPHVAMRAGSGLIALARSADQPRRLQALLDICPSGHMPLEVERVFLRLGQGLDLLSRDKQRSQQLAELRREAEAQAAERESNEGLLAEIRAAYEQRGRKLADLQSRLFDLEHQQAALPEIEAQISALKTSAEEQLAAERRTRFKETEFLTRQVEQIRAAHAGLEAEAADLRRQLDKARAASSQQAAKNAALQARLDQSRTMLERRTAEKENLRKQLDQSRKTLERRTAEKEALRKQLDQARQGSERQAADLAGLRQQFEKTQQMLESKSAKSARLLVENRQQKKHLDKLLGSTSWRITAPMRKVKSAFSR